MSEQITLYISCDYGATDSKPEPEYNSWDKPPEADKTRRGTLCYLSENGPQGELPEHIYDDFFPEPLHLAPGQLAKLTINMEIIK